MNDKETLRQRLYANSPHDLASEEDDTYRDAIDQALDQPEEFITTNYYSTQDMPKINSTFTKDGENYKVISNDVLNQSTARRVDFGFAPDADDLREQSKEYQDELQEMHNHPAEGPQV